MSSKQKAYCTCKDWMNGPYFGLFKAGETKKGKGSFQFVHWPCAKPSPVVWRAWLTMCEICLGLFSSPWSTICKECWREEGREGPYPGWAWARKAQGK